MGKKKKKAPPAAPLGAPEWVVTFTDMISLLVTFFVLLMTFSSLEASELVKVDSWLDRSPGVHKSKSSSLPTPPQDDMISETDYKRGALNPHSRPSEELAENLAEMGQKKSDDQLELDLTNVADGIVIEFGADESFDPGSTRVSERLRESLAEIGRVLEHYAHMIVVEGFTDDAFVPSREYASATSLSFARADAASRVLLAESGLRPELVQVAGLGSNPRADDKSLEGRRLNRRVQIRILSLSRARANYLEALERDR